MTRPGTQTLIMDLQRELADLRAQLAERDAEIKRLSTALGDRYLPGIINEAMHRARIVFGEYPDPMPFWKAYGHGISFTIEQCRASLVAAASAVPTDGE